ncbi:uncharacterized protein N0V89_008375 [Didymosphaeria variabile]|uniref:Uncharacterized protein n=1 Tax=Didymosphaeria variabile TaxID=1932322 RepID=A0A9W8XHF5_9PLEO|nr:uncharacterized protein N0V89_008375 [Didymosphaeria variabile]KAJ4349757.1 hypothetical protein N0V89_008375 [Didymosphaeria variabile]
MTITSSERIAPNTFVDEDDNNPHDERLDQATVTTGESIGDVQELNRPLIEQEYMDRSFAPEKATTPEAKVDLAPGDIEDRDAGTSVVNDLSAISPAPAPVPSTLYPGSPNDDLVEKRATTTTDLPEQPDKHDTSDPVVDTLDTRGSNIGSLVQRGINNINSAVPVDDNTSPTTDTLTSTSTASIKDSLNLFYSAKVPVKNSSDKKPAAMAKVDWLKKLDGVAAPDYDGEWEDSPSRGATVLHEQLLEDDVVAEPLTTPTHNREHLVAPEVASKHRYVPQTFPNLGENLVDELEDINLDSPAKKPPKQDYIAELLDEDADTIEYQPSKAKASHRSALISVATIANKQIETDGFFEATFGQHHPEILRPALAPETPVVHGVGHRNTPKLRTPVGPSPMPSFSELRDRAGHNLKHGSGPQRDFPRTAAPKDNPINDVSSRTNVPTASTENVVDKEYADVSMDMLDYEMGNCGSKDYPTYYFPGTYEAVKHDTYEAAMNVSSAAKSFRNAVGMSGVGKALWSVGAFTAKGTRRAATVLGTQATMSAINLGYKESLPPHVAQWATSKNQEEERKAERKKPNYKLVDEPRYKKADPAKYVLEKKLSTAQKDLIDLDDDLEEEDWTMVNVKETTDQTLQPASTCRVHGEEPPTGYQDGLPNTPYETIMTTVESTAGFVAQVGRTVRGQAIALADRQRQRQLRKQRAEEWPKDARELVQSNRYERLQTIGRLTSPHYTKIHNTHGDLAYPDRPAAYETDDVSDNYDDMVLSDEELKG